MRATLIQVTTSLLAFFSFTLGVYSLVRNPKARVVRIWFLASMAVTIWSVGYLLTNRASLDKAALYIKVVYFGASIIPILSYHFVASFLFREHEVKLLLKIGYVCAGIFLVLNVFTKYIVSGVRYKVDFGSYEEVSTPLFYFFLAYFLFYSFTSIYLLLREYLYTGGAHKRKIFYLALALSIGFIGGISNFVTDLTGVYPYGQMIVWLYPIIVTYGIFVDEVKIKIRF